MAFAGTIVVTGRGTGVVVATGTRTELGGIAATVLGQAQAKPLLLVKMGRFTHGIALWTGVATAVVAESRSGCFSRLPG